MASAARIPIVDISATGEEAQAQVAVELVEAAVEHGFVYIKNTGADIPAEAVANAFKLGGRLFEAPIKEKQECIIQKNNRGWGGLNYETLDPKTQRVGDFKEAFNFGPFENGKAQQPLPESVARYESEYSDFYDHCYNLSLKINHLLGIGLAVSPPTFFRDRHLREGGPSGNILRFLYYPPFQSLAPGSANPAEDVRAGAHSDYGSITLLFRLKGQAGLEIELPDGSWAPVPVSPPGTEEDASPPILVNIGDLLSYWTNGLLRSTVHRVVFPGPGKGKVEGESDAEPRYSIAFFCHPVGTTTLGPIPSERVRNFRRTGPTMDGGENGRGGNPDLERKAITADEHLQMRLRATYLQMYEKQK